jgi:hypothetical protein
MRKEECPQRDTVLRVSHILGSLPVRWRELLSISHKQGIIRHRSIMIQEQPDHRRLQYQQLLPRFPVSFPVMVALLLIQPRLPIPRLPRLHQIIREYCDRSIALVDKQFTLSNNSMAR